MIVTPVQVQPSAIHCLGTWRFAKYFVVDVKFLHELDPCFSRLLRKTRIQQFACDFVVVLSVLADLVPQSETVRLHVVTDVHGSN